MHKKCQKGIDFMVYMLYSEDAKTIKEDARRRYHGIHQRHRKGMRGLGGYREQGAERSQRYQSGYQRKGTRGGKADRLHAKLRSAGLKNEPYL